MLNKIVQTESVATKSFDTVNGSKEQCEQQNFVQNFFQQHRIIFVLFTPSSSRLLSVVDSMSNHSHIPMQFPLSCGSQDV